MRIERILAGMGLLVIALFALAAVALVEPFDDAPDPARMMVDQRSP